MDDVDSSHRRDGWIETEATIISCKPTLLSSFRGSGITQDGFFQPPEYTVVFQYGADHETFNGKYRSNSEQAVGSLLTIAYDPLKPQRNTGAGLIMNPWIRVGAWLVGAGLAAFALWLGSSSVPQF